MCSRTCMQPSLKINADYNSFKSGFKNQPQFQEVLYSGPEALSGKQTLVDSSMCFPHIKYAELKWNKLSPMGVTTKNPFGFLRTTFVGNCTPSAVSWRSPPPPQWILSPTCGLFFLFLCLISKGKFQIPWFIHTWSANGRSAKWNKTTQWWWRHCLSHCNQLWQLVWRPERAAIALLTHISVTQCNPGTTISLSTISNNSARVASHSSTGVETHSSFPCQFLQLSKSPQDTYHPGGIQTSFSRSTQMFSTVE